MVAYCNDCKRYINQYCDRCAGNFGITICEKYACGGTMRCPVCGGSNLSAKKEFGPDPYDYRAQSREEAVKGAAPAPAPEPANAPAEPQPGHCPMCGYKVMVEWKYCPMCGVSFTKQ